MRRQSVFNRQQQRDLVPAPIHYVRPQATKICPGCNERIEGTWFSALGQSWHQDHFRCVHCKTLLSGQTFNSKDDKPYCNKDFLNLFGKKCRKCGSSIEGASLFILDDYWHPEHFLCVLCYCQLDVDHFYEKNGKSFCKECFEEEKIVLCEACNQIITDQGFKGMEKNWHNNCFKCAKSSKLIENEMPVQDGKAKGNTRKT